MRASFILFDRIYRIHEIFSPPAIEIPFGRSEEFRITAERPCNPVDPADPV
jgi:hypothetical protein